MPKSVVEPQGCLTAILSLFGIRLARRQTELPYRLRDDFLSAVEYSFYRVLLSVLGDIAVVCPKVNLADIFYVARPNENQGWRNKIDRKHVDFLLCEPILMKPLLGIELDDVSHQRPSRIDRDEFVDEVFETAHLALIRFPARRSYNPSEIKALVEHHLASVDRKSTRLNSSHRT